MIDEDELRALLSEAAEAVPPPGRAPQALLDAIAEDAVPVRRANPKRRLALAAAAAVVLLVMAASVTLKPSSPQDTASNTSADAGGQATDAGSVGEREAQVDGADSPQLTETGGGTTASGSAVVPTPAAPSGLTPATPSDPAPAKTPVGPPTDTAKVIRTGSLDLEVRKGTFESTVERITSQAVGLGGYVSESTTSESGESPSGSIVVRVPGKSFDQLLGDLRKLGDVKAVTSKGTDVTAQFTDLAARLTALKATRDRLQSVLAEADNVPDILAVQDRITNVQVEIEQVQGQQKLLDDQTAYGTLSVTLGEPGAEVIKAEPQGDGGLGGAWDEARQRFGDNVETIVSWSGAAAVAVIVGLLALLALRIGWVTTRRRLV